MRTLRSVRALLVVAVALSVIPAPSMAQLYLNISAPPLLPTYNQPPVPAQNDIWTPGYWAWGSSGYYWVPGTWVPAPQPGLLWTPGYWNASQSGYSWNQGYWAQNVGYYGGVNYGSGYYGNGYAGGNWSGNAFRYNTAVTNVNTRIIRNVYVNRIVIVRTVNRVSYYGGRFGLHEGPTPAQLAVVRLRHVPLTPLQVQHIAAAARDRSLLVSVNHGTPPHPAVVHPLSATNRPMGLKPVTTSNGQTKQPAVPAHHAMAAPKPAPHAMPAAKPAQHAKPPAKPAHPAAKPAPAKPGGP